MPNSKNWVDYREIKSRVTMEMVLERYGLLSKFKPSGRNYTGVCPIHNGTNPRQFSVNLEKSMWNCFGDCKCGGNILDFVARMENVTIRNAGLLLKDWFLRTPEPAESPAEDSDHVVPSEHGEQKGQLVREETEDAGRQSHRIRAAQSRRKSVNPPLTFKLKLTPDHPFFEERGIATETVAQFGMGYCSKGLLRGRIAIPIHDHDGHLVAYCGRATSPDQIEKGGRYKLPSKFKKSEVVYNLNRIERKTSFLILVESYISVFKLHQAGIQNVVAIMGSVLSERQESLIVDHLTPTGRVYLMFDADPDGKTCAADVLSRLSRHAFVKSLDIGRYARKPHQLTPDQLTALLSKESPPPM